MIISVKQNRFIGVNPIFFGEEYVIDISRKLEGYEAGSIIIYGCPFGASNEFPLQLSIGIKRDGSFNFRSWVFTKLSINPYFHVSQSDLESFIKNKAESTQEQLDAVAGLFSGRIRFEGLKLSMGTSIQTLCPIDLEKEEERIKKKIFLN